MRQSYPEIQKVVEELFWKYARECERKKKECVPVCIKWVNVHLQRLTKQQASIALNSLSAGLHSLKWMAVWV